MEFDDRFDSLVVEIATKVQGSIDEGLIEDPFDIAFAFFSAVSFMEVNGLTEGFEEFIKNIENARVRILADEYN